jgi:hypothetical protein
MSTWPLASPDECPTTIISRCNFCSSSPASVVMPFDVDATRGCCSMGNVFLRCARCFKIIFIYFSDSGL